MGAVATVSGGTSVGGETSRVQVGALLESGLRDALVERARRNDRSVASELRRAVRCYLAADESAVDEPVREAHGG